MKVLQVNCVYKKGSTGKITYDLHKALTEKGVESVVCYGRGERTNEPNVYKTCGELYSKINQLLTRINGVMYGGCFFSTNKLLSIIKKEKPDVVHLQCINGYFVNIYRLINWLKRHNVKTVLTLHAEFMYTANCGHSYDCEKWKTGCGNCPNLKRETKSLFFDNTSKSFKKMQKAFDGFNENLIVTSVSPWLMERAKQSPILSDKNHTVVMNGLDTNIFYIYDSTKLKKEYNITDEKVIFHATPYFTDDPDYIKGGYYIKKLAEKLKNENIKVVVAGEYKSSINVPDNIVLLGKVANQNLLAKLYSMADVTVIASKRETFSMVCAESLCCGTPVVGFKAGGPESISLEEYSEFVDYGDISALENSVFDYLKKKLSAEEISDKAQKIYDKTNMCRNYITVYERLNG